MRLGIADIIFINALMLRYFGIIDYSYSYIFLWWILSVVIGGIITILIKKIFR